jgi:hypothetical protein
MSDSDMREPGLDLHEWETRWRQLLEVAEESPADAVGEMDRLVEEMLGEGGYLETDGEARKQFEAARDLMRRYESGGASAGDLAAAIEGYREVYELVSGTSLEPSERAGGGARTA